MRRGADTACLGVLGAALLSGCAEPVLALCDAAEAPGLVAWVVDHGWHTEIAVPAGKVGGPLAVFRSTFPAAQALSFGFGKRDFMTLARTGSADLVAGLVPGKGTVRVVPLPAQPVPVHPAQVVQVSLTPQEWSRLSDFLWRSVAQADGTVAPVAADAGLPGQFFAAVPGYSLAYTCNAWTVDGLRHAGFEVGGAVVFAGGAMREAASVRGACAPSRPAYVAAAVTFPPR